AQYTLLTTTYQSPAPTRCTYPIFNPVKKSSVATAPSIVPSLSSSLPAAALSTYKPALTSCAPVTKTRKKENSFQPIPSCQYPNRSACCLRTRLPWFSLIP
ncbi:unnamed protein product, partial [Staurois parvus]